MAKVWLAVEVDIPAGFDVNELPGYLSKFIDIGLADLHDSCSYGNLGMIVPSHFVPLAAPGIVAQGIRWMFNSKSPFYVKPSLNLSLMDWGLKFIKSATEENVSKAGKPLTEINLLSKQLYEQLTAQPGFDFSFEKKGIMMYFKSDKVAEEEIHMAATAKTMGLDVQVLSTKEAQDLEPEIELDVLGAVHYKCDAHLYPNKLNQQLIQFLQSKNVKFELGTPISSVITNQNKINNLLFTETLRKDYYSSIENKATGKIGIKYFLNDTISLYSNAGTGYRQPTLYELYAPALSGPVGNTMLTPEKTKGFDLGLNINSFSIRWRNTPFISMFSSNSTQSCILKHLISKSS